MRIGYQGETHSYSFQAAERLFGGSTAIGFDSFASVFAAFESGEVDRLVLPIENSTTGSVLPVLDRLLDATRSRPLTIVAENLVEVRHALLGVTGAVAEDVREAWSHPQALSQAEGTLYTMGIHPRACTDTAGAVREVAAAADPTIAALAPAAAGAAHGLTVLRSNLMDQDHNMTRFVVLAPAPCPVPVDANKTTVAFRTSHTPGALALALTELGLRGANLTRIESRPANERWTYRFFVDLLHEPGEQGVAGILDPLPATCRDLTVLGSYPAAKILAEEAHRPT